MDKINSLSSIRLTALVTGAFAFAACFTELTHPAPADGDINKTDVMVSPADVAPGDPPTRDGAPDLPLSNTGGTAGSDAPGEARPVDGGTGEGTGGVVGDGGAGGIVGGGGGAGGIVGSGGIVAGSGGTVAGTGGTVAGNGGVIGNGGGGGSTTIDAPIDQTAPGTVGAACTINGDCTLGNCANGVCCATACAGCNACSAALTGKADGTCAPAKTGLDPNSFCADERTTTPCGNDGTCDGAGACRKAGNTQPCKDPSCSGSVFTQASTCNGSGTCVAGTPQECAPFQCALTGCLKTCSGNADCGATSYCKTASGTTGTCTSKNPNGTPATQPHECVSGIVADGVCCDKLCTGCNACSGAPLTGAPTGTCSFVLDGQIAHNACAASGLVCGLDGKCDGAGACRSNPKTGQSCDDPANKCVTGRVCQSGTCTAGTPKTCPASTLQCRSAGTCDPATGSCTYPWAPDGASCTDNNACTNDTCQGGSCVTSQILCNNPPVCKLSTTCSGGACSYTQNVADGTADAKCPGATPYCYSGTCVRCTSDTQCSVPTPTCDAGLHACVCRRASNENIVTNPGFDSALSGWEASSVSLTTDSEGCSNSRAGYVQSGGDYLDPQQCVPMTGGRWYYFGGKFKTTSNSSGLRLRFYPTANCTPLGSYTHVWEYNLPYSPNWDTQKSMINVPPGTVSAVFGILGMDLSFDQLYINSSADQF